MKKAAFPIAKYFYTFLVASILYFGVINSLHAQEMHTVRSGETLFGISRTYNVSVDDLKKWNELSGNVISIGQELIVSNTNSRISTAQPSDETGFTHSVQSGETLFRISQVYGVSVNDLRQWNNLTGDRLEIGQILKIKKEKPEDRQSTARPSGNYHVVRRGETLFRIAQIYDMSVSELQRINNLNHSTLEIGQRLLVSERSPAPTSEINGGITEAFFPEPLGAFMTHVLKENETVEGLLSRNRMSEEEFINLNPHLELDEIKSGEMVTILRPAASQRNPYRISSNLASTDKIYVTMYDPQHKGNTTTSGDLYNPDHLTAAHPSLPLGKIIYIENPSNDKGIFIQINDRVTGNFLKLSSAAFHALGFDGDSELAVRIFNEFSE